MYSTAEDLNIPPSEFAVGDLIYRPTEPGITYKVLGYERDTHQETYDSLIIARTSFGTVVPETIPHGVPRYRWYTLKPAKDQ